MFSFLVVLSFSSHLFFFLFSSLLLSLFPFLPLSHFCPFSSPTLPSPIFSSLLFSSPLLPSLLFPSLVFILFPSLISILFPFSSLLLPSPPLSSLIFSSPPLTSFLFPSLPFSSPSLSPVLLPFLHTLFFSIHTSSNVLFSLQRTRPIH